MAPRTPTPHIQLDEVSGAMTGPMGQYYGDLSCSSPEFAARLVLAINSFDGLLSLAQAVAKQAPATPLGRQATALLAQVGESA